jgi:hypothetical protein
MKLLDLERAMHERMPVAVFNRAISRDIRQGRFVPHTAIRARVLDLRQQRWVPARRGVGGTHAHDGVLIALLDETDASRVANLRQPADRRLIAQPVQLLDTWTGYQRRLAEQAQTRAEQADAERERDLQRAREHAQLELLASVLGGRAVRHPQQGILLSTDAASRLAELVADSDNGVCC